MKKYLNTRQMILLGILLVLMVAFGAVFAYMFMRTEAQSTQFIPAKVDCAVTNSGTVIVQNTGNIDAYLRVRLVPYWYDTVNDGVAAKASPALTIEPKNGWIPGTDYTYYYPTPVAPDASTGSLLTDAIVLANSPEGYEPRIDVFAEAIQSLPVEAVTSSWGVTVTGETITTVP